MAPPTRSQPFRTLSPEPLANREATTRRKTKYIDTVLRNRGSRSLHSLAANAKISESTGRKWMKQWQNIGSEAMRKTWPKSKILGKKSRVTKSMCKLLCSPSRNPVRKQLYKAQI